MLWVFGPVMVIVMLAAGCSQQTPGSDERTRAPSREPSLTPDTADQQAAKNENASSSERPASKLEDRRGEDVGESDRGETESGQDQKTGSQSATAPEHQAQTLKWLDEMASEATLERRAASQALDELVEPGMPSVVHGLREGTLSQKRGAAIYLIGRVSPRDDAAKSALIETLSADDASLRHAALQAVEKLAEEQLVEALPQLVALAENGAETEAYRSRAIRAITKLEAGGRPATEDLIQLARDENESLKVRRACFYAILKVAPSDVAEEFFRAALRHSDAADLRRLAAKWLVSVASAPESLDCLVAALSDPDKPVRLEAVDSLVDIGKPSLSALIKALESPDVQTRRYATLAIGKLGILAADAAPALKPLLDDPDQQVRELARVVLDLLPQQ